MHFSDSLVTSWQKFLITYNIKHIVYSFILTWHTLIYLSFSISICDIK